jgi:hypothetical protein
LFDVGPASEAEEADRDVSHRGHDLWGGAGSDLGSVFVEGDVADMVFAVFYSWSVPDFIDTDLSCQVG